MSAALPRFRARPGSFARDQLRERELVTAQRDLVAADTAAATAKARRNDLLISLRLTGYSHSALAEVLSRTGTPATPNLVQHVLARLSKEAPPE